MDFVNNLKNILETQRKALKQFEEELSSIEKFDILYAYHSLEEKVKTRESGLEPLKAEHAELEKKYRAEKEALSGEIYSQKLNLLSFSQTRVFKRCKDFEMNHSAKLGEIELSAEEKLAKKYQSVTNVHAEVKNMLLPSWK